MKCVAYRAPRGRVCRLHAFSAETSRPRARPPNHLSAVADSTICRSHVWSWHRMPFRQQQQRSAALLLQLTRVLFVENATTPPVVAHNSDSTYCTGTVGFTSSEYGTHTIAHDRRPPSRAGPRPYPLKPRCETFSCSTRSGSEALFATKADRCAMPAKASRLERPSCPCCAGRRFVAAEVNGNADRSKEACGSMQLLGDFREYRYGDIQPYREYRIYLSTCTHIFSLK
eukprot:SAG11_NODE_775_length_7226_cov_2.988214_5_plen_228_part_00